LPFDELKSNLDAAYKKIGAQIRIPGFRPGKAPARIIDGADRTPVSEANRSRTRSSCSSTSASYAIRGRALRSGSVISGRTSTSAVSSATARRRGCHLDLGWANACTPLSSTALVVHAGSASLTASSSTAPGRPAGR